MKVWTNGCFDLLTPGHFNLLMLCRELAGPEGKVIVGVDEDEKVMADKGLRRPVFNVHERAKAVLDLKVAGKQVVDEVEFFFTNKQLENIIRRIKPDYIVKGGDWRDKHVVGSEFAKVLFYERMEQYSTTEIIRRVLEKNTLLK